ncbi:MAG: M23 family metallopeptidase, partial [Dehalococcoidia bacterium]
MNIKLRLALTMLMVSAVCVIAFAPTPQTAQAVLPVVAPTTGWVTQEFGGCPTQGECHAAIDIAGPPTLPGAPVYAMAAGVVIQRIQQSNGYGCYIVIDHGSQGGGQNLYSLYSHLGWKDAQGVTQGCYFNVALNQQVSRGQQIGKQGNSGLATGTHLHFGVYAYPPPWSGAHHAIDPGQCIGFAPYYTALTTGPGCGPGTCPHDLADGCLLRAVPSNRYFVFFGGAEFHVPNPATLSSLYGNQPAWDVSDQYADTLAGRVPRDGTLLRDTSNGNVHVIWNGARFLVPNATVLRDIYCPSYPQVDCPGDLWHEAVIGISNSIPDGTLLRDAADGAIYVIAGGAKFHIPDPTTLVNLYCQSPEGCSVGSLWHEALTVLATTPGDGTIIRDALNGMVHVVFGAARFHVPDPTTLSALYCPGYPQPGCWTNLWHDAAEGLPTVPADGATLQEQTDPRVYSFCSG